jgi:negative regulator of flagellin synthesis FlgM
MSNVNGIQPPVGPSGIEPVSHASAPRAAAEVSNIKDVVEISNIAKLAAQVQELPDVRADLVARVKAEIAAGNYETPERLDVAISRLMDDLLPPES